MTGRLKLAAQVAALALVTGLFALFVWKVATQGEGAAPKLSRGETPPAPGFHLDRLDRPGSLSLASYRGRPVILNFWASWCIPCKQEAPMLESVWKRYRSQGLVVLGVDINDVRGEARRFARKNKMSYPLVYDGPGDGISDFGVTGAPETYVIDPEGRVVEAFVGAINTEEDRRRLRAAIAEAQS